MSFINNTFRNQYVGGSFIGSHQFRNYVSVNATTFFYPDLRPQFVGGSFIGAHNYRTGIVLESTIITPFLQTFFQIYGRDGGLKETWYYNQDSITAAMNLKIEVTKNGSGAGTLKLAFLNFPIEVEDEIRVFIGGSMFYRGFFENVVDISAPIGIIAPYSKRTKEILYTGSFTLEDPRDIMETVITATASETGVNWDNTKVDFEDVLDPVTVDYQAESVYAIVNEMVNRGFNKYWGVDTDNDFFIEESQTTTPSQILYLGENPRYGDIKVKETYRKIKMTEAAVYAKRTVIISGEDVTQTEFIANVGTGGSYPVLELRKKFRKIQGKLTAPEVLPTDTAVLDWAYGRLTEKEAKVRKTITLRDYDIINYTLSVGETITVEDKDKLTLLDLDITSNLTSWTNATIGTGRYQNDAIVLNSTNDGYYDLKDCTKWYKQEQIGFFISGAIDQQIQVALSDNPTPLTSEFQTISLRSTGVFDFYKLNLTAVQEFRYIVFNVVGTDIILDEINILCYNRSKHTDQVSSIMVQFQPDKIKADVKMGDLIDEESFEMFERDRKIRILENIDRI